MGQLKIYPNCKQTLPMTGDYKGLSHRFCSKCWSKLRGEKEEKGKMRLKLSLIKSNKTLQLQVFGESHRKPAAIVNFDTRVSQELRDSKWILANICKIREESLCRRQGNFSYKQNELEYWRLNHIPECYSYSLFAFNTDFTIHRGTFTSVIVSICTGIGQEHPAVLFQ